MSHNNVLSTELIQVENSSRQTREDLLAVELPLEIRLCHKDQNLHTLAITLCSPNNIQDLVAGYLFTENIIKSLYDISDLKVYDNEFGLVAEVELLESINFLTFLNKRNGMVQTSCGLCGKTSFDELMMFSYPKTKPPSKQLSAKLIYTLPEKLNQQQSVFTQTGGTHASCLFSLDGELIYSREDIGRHNALDKLIGACLGANISPLSDYLILLSGRVSFELVHKTLMAGSKTLISIGSPSSLSLEIAMNNELTLIGFTKPDKFNIYHSTSEVF
ncbi:MAG: formate dehydrogenase accessory sulfurtransferase FdhD [Proteobacteria bacterium]|nr:formate dehydrogenase accessory sulfurtransferase FdhD [Pseudomonadota bacterium]